ncbi:tail fiber assembly protein [Herbaspirillum sp. B65]|uniref:tail fiber assembly protein n=1 Tax=Herbaspirillum sp. B65 TaxID=137708 RepID=UPI000678DF30|nr:tail fiber assembly protein [Herbaspirillum sp. B65]
MQTFAIIEKDMVVNIVLSDDTEQLARGLAQGQRAEGLPTDSSVAIGDRYAKGKFISCDRSPAPLALDMEQVLARNKVTYTGLMTIAGMAIEPLKDAAELGQATAEELSALAAWRQYRIDLSRVNLSADPVEWPAEPSATP